jgi:hypothetical protein
MLYGLLTIQCVWMQRRCIEDRTKTSGLIHATNGFGAVLVDIVQPPFQPSANQSNADVWATHTRGQQDVLAVAGHCLPIVPRPFSANVYTSSI